MNDEPLIRQSHVQWHLVEGKAVASTLDGRSIFAWRNEYMELAARFVEYADHTAACDAAREGHHHTPLADDRIVCHMAPCTCGLLIILSLLNSTITYGIHCPDVPTPLPTRQIFNDDGTPLRIYGMPVYESDDAPDNVILPLPTRTDADTSDDDIPFNMPDGPKPPSPNHRRYTLMDGSFRDVPEPPDSGY
jgi:hypothetical protein